MAQNFYLFSFILLLLLSCDTSSKAQFSDEKLSQPFTDSRNGKQYKTVKIGNITWMADNLDYETGDSLSWCYKDDCKKYWRLYNWEKAKNVCPSGWHLPTTLEWSILDDAVFLLPDGNCDGYFGYNMFEYKGWWTAGAYIYNPKMKDDLTLTCTSDDLSNLGCTVRCVQDYPVVLNFSNVVEPLYDKNEDYLDSLKSAIYESPTKWCGIIEQGSSEINRLAKNDTLLKRIITFYYNKICVKPAEITAYWLNSKTKEYERIFNKPVPECKQCTDLELLLMLEDAIKTNKAELDIIAKEENATLKAELKKAQTDYEKKFKIRAPWWYMCSDKEHLERLQKAIKANEPELDYSYGFQMKNYKIGKMLASYERQFKKPIPNLNKEECSDEERLNRLTEALRENKPYLAKEKEKNRHSFHFKYGDNYISNMSSISVSKTATGAVAKYELPIEKRHNDAETFEANISVEEWKNFTDALQKLGVMEWQSLYGEQRFFNEKNWEVEIFFPTGAQFNSSGNFAYPPNWDEFMKLMEGLKKKISQELESKLKTEYEKKFKKPITEQELSTEQVRFSTYLENKTPINSTSYITITRTATGAVTHYNHGTERGVKFSTDDWLDFIHALYKTSFTKWDEEYGKIRMKNDSYGLKVYNSNDFKPRSYYINNKYPPNWDKFIKIMNDIRAKAKKDSMTIETENKLKIEYKKRFGKPISDLELSIKSMKFHAVSLRIGSSVSIYLNRTSAGALIEYTINLPPEDTILKEKLSMEEWLDFLNNLQKCPDNGSSGKWKRWDMCCRKNLNDYAILNPHTWHLEIKSSGDADELRFYARDLCTPKWDDFMKIINKRKITH